ncbi:hypothetical protein [Pedobacter sp. SYP-B3415]|uniref:hypothetical protein n=1 Tax=Pedobacter sp. SYP-B3415 TaxID=2496641 RepID=UPI00101D4E98|nr:hypothetical protein [Pedobacter sp. SYP-B3415]
MMNQQEIFRKLGTILDELNDQYAYLAENPDKLSGLETELFLANADFLADHAAIIKKMNEKTAGSDIDPADRAPVVSRPESVPAQLADPVVTAAAVPLEPETAAPGSRFTREESSEAADEIPAVRGEFERDIFKPDDSNQSFEFIINEREEREQTTENDWQQDIEEEDEQLADIATAEEDEARIDIDPEFETDAETTQPQPTVERVPEGWDTEPETSEDEDEIGPEPFLVEGDSTSQQSWPEQQEPLKGADLRGERQDSLHVQSAPAKGPVELTPEPARQAERPDAAAAPMHTNITEPITAPTEEKKLNINELFARNREAGEKQQEGGQAPISDLKQAISLNDKLLFIRELFNGYNLAYSEAIDLTNKMNTFDQADAFLQKNYAAKNNWGSKQLTVDKLYELLRRRFPA